MPILPAANWVRRGSMSRLSQPGKAQSSLSSSFQFYTVQVLQELFERVPYFDHPSNSHHDVTNRGKKILF